VRYDPKWLSLDSSIISFVLISCFSRLGVKTGGCSVYHKTNRETMVEIGDSVRGKDVYIIQTGTKFVKNTNTHGPHQLRIFAVLKILSLGILKE
jgi:phosphoribosylpyrophosphate synthetase